VVLGVVVDGVVVGAGAVVVGAGGTGFSVRGSGGGEDCGVDDDGTLPTSETSALDGGGEAGAVAGDDAGAAGGVVGTLGWVVFGCGLDASFAPSVPRVSAVMLTNPTANARMHAPTSATRRFRAPARFSAIPASATDGVLSSAGKDSRTVAGETGTLEAFRNPRAAKRLRVSGRRRARAAACSSWSGP